jgi:nucleotide sugar dehydrogenase
MTNKALSLESKIKRKEARIGIIGMGYVGLPLVKTFLSKGFEVLGFDIDEKKVDLLNQGKSYIKHVTGEELKAFLKKKKFQATTDFELLSKVDVILICVPTPLDSYKNPDLSYVLNTTEVISKNLRKGQLVVLEKIFTWRILQKEKIQETRSIQLKKYLSLSEGSPKAANESQKLFTTRLLGRRSLSPRQKSPKPLN